MEGCLDARCVIRGIQPEGGLWACRVRTDRPMLTQQLAGYARGKALPEVPEGGLVLGRPRVCRCVWDFGGASISDDFQPEERLLREW